MILEATIYDKSHVFVSKFAPRPWSTFQHHELGLEHTIFFHAWLFGRVYSLDVERI